MSEDFIGVSLGDSDKYEIREFLGAGDVTLVFVAYDHSLQRQVAIKIIKPEYAISSDVTDAFIKETHIKNLKHRHILSVYDRGDQMVSGQRLVYLVMQLAGGGTLLERLGRQPLTLDEAERILKQVCGALDDAYHHGLIHSGLELRDILLNEHGDVLLADFNRVQPLAETVDVTAQADELRTQPTQKQASVFSDVCNLSIALYKNVLIPLNRNRLTWRRWALCAAAGLALVVAVLVSGVRPPLSDGPKVATYATAHPTVSASPTVTLMSLPPSTPTLNPATSTVAAPLPTPYVVVNVERLSIYAGPGDNYEEWGEVRRGDQLPLCSRSADGMWWQVDYLSWKGWIRAQGGEPYNIEPTLLPTVEALPSPTSGPTPTRTPTPTDTPMPGPTSLYLNNSGFDKDIVQVRKIPDWESWAAEDEFCDPPFFERIYDPARMINGATLQVQSVAFRDFAVHIYQTAGAPPNVTVRFQVLARAYSALESGRIKLAVGIDPNGTPGCSQAQRSEELIINQADGKVQLVTPDVVVGYAGRVTVCLYAETLYPARSNAAFFDDAELIAHPE